MHRKMTHTKQQKVADLQRILAHLLQSPTTIQFIYLCRTDDATFAELKDRLQEIKTDLEYGKLHY